MQGLFSTLFPGKAIPPIRAGATPPFVPKQPQGGLLNIPYYDDVVVPQMGVPGQTPPYVGPVQPTPFNPAGGPTGPAPGAPIEPMKFEPAINEHGVVSLDPNQTTTKTQIGDDMEAAAETGLLPIPHADTGPSKTKLATGATAGAAATYGAAKVMGGNQNAGVNIEQQKEQVAAASGQTVDELESAAKEEILANAETPEEKSMLEQISSEVDLLTVGLAMMAGNDGSQSFGQLLGSAMLAGVSSKRNRDELAKRNEQRDREVKASETRAAAAWVDATTNNGLYKPVNDKQRNEAKDIASVALGLNFDEEDLAGENAVFLTVAAQKIEEYRRQYPQASHPELGYILRNDPELAEYVKNPLFGKKRVDSSAVNAAIDDAPIQNPSLLERELNQ